MDSPHSIKDLIKSAKVPERSVPICLNVGINADIEELERRLEELGKQPDTASLEGDPRTAVAEQIAALEQEAKEHTVEFRLRARRQVYTALLKEHPPREDDPVDQTFGFNRDTFFPPLIKASTVAPELDDDDWVHLIGDDENDGVLSFRQFDYLSGAAYWVNSRDVDVPKSQAASKILRSSEAA